MKIYPNDILAPGTKVRVKNKRGEVISHEEHKDQFGAPIIVHTIKLTEKFKCHISNVPIWEVLEKPIISKPNYSFVEIIG